MGAPPIVFGFSPAAIVPVFLAAATAFLFWDRVVPRQLRGLQVAFQTGENRYEVHKVTTSLQDAKDLLSSPGMRFGVYTYLFALTGVLIFLFEYLLAATGISDGYHAISLALALLLILWPAVVSAGSSLGAQVIKPIGHSRATLQDSSVWRSYSYVLLTVFWFGLVSALALVLSIQEVPKFRIFSIAALVAFSPAVLAYGRVLGSSWHALSQSSKQISEGKPSPFHNHSPSPRQQLVAMIVYWNLMAMPWVALNTVLSLLTLAVAPDVFSHSDRVLNLPEYTLQSSVMEEGGILGFALIELFSFIPLAAIRVPLVTGVLLFLLLNVALIGFLFVYEVARILFLDVADVSGKGGIKLADSRLLRAEISQQAKVLNFCFTGFAGQSMLLLALAMMTFWDSSFLPQGEACGAWQGSVCDLMSKDALEELTWMLSSGGQIAFFAIWVRSLGTASKLEEVQFDASMGEDRAMLSQIEDVIYLKQRPLSELLAKDEWDKVLSRIDTILQGHGVELEGLDLVRRTEAMMTCHAALGRFDEAEQEAVSLLALRGGREARVARQVLAASSLAQRDMAEAKPRLALLGDEEIEAARLQWFASILDPKNRKLPNELTALLAIDPITKRNVDLIKRMMTGKSLSNLKILDTEPGRKMFLGDIARLRLDGQFDIALNMLEKYIEDNEMNDWATGNLVLALLHLDSGRVHTAADMAEKLAKKHPRHPHIRSFLGYLANRGHTDNISTEETGLEWLIDSGADWIQEWPRIHTISPAPTLADKHLKQHAWKANAWITHDVGNGLTMALEQKSKGWKSIDETTKPACLYLHLSGVIVTLGGLPVDLGLPGDLNLSAIENAGLLNLSN